MQIYTLCCPYDGLSPILFNFSLVQFKMKQMQSQFELTSRLFMGVTIQPIDLKLLMAQKLPN